MADEELRPIQLRVHIPARPDHAEIVVKIAERICELENTRGVPGQPITYDLGYDDEPWPEK